MQLTKLLHTQTDNKHKARYDSDQQRLLAIATTFTSRPGSNHAVLVDAVYREYSSSREDRDQPQSQQDWRLHVEIENLYLVTPTYAQIRRMRIMDQCVINKRAPENAR